MKMFEKIATAIFIADTSEGWDDGSGIEKRMDRDGQLRAASDYIDHAAAVLLVMREPTEVMVEAGAQVDRWVLLESMDPQPEVFTAQIDAALEEIPE